MLASRELLATEGTEAAFRKRYVDAAQEVLKPVPMGEEAKPFEEAFYTAVRAQPGFPSLAFTAMLLKNLKGRDTKADDIVPAFQKTFDAQNALFLSWYNEQFANAIEGPVPTNVVKAAAQDTEARSRALEAQKRTVARLLFGLCRFRAAEAIETKKADAQDLARLKDLAPTGADFGVKLLATTVYKNMFKRVMVVCGPSHALDAISDRTAVLRQLTDYMTGTLAEEQRLFISDHAILLEEVKRQASLLQKELALKAENERKLGVQEQQVKKRQRDVKQLEDELKESRAITKERTKALRELSQSLLDDRLKARDLIRLTEESEKAIRELERKIRDLERKR
jgi:hypothetical protein